MAFDVGAVVGQLQLKKDQWNQAIKDVKADQRSLNGLVLRNSRQFKQMGRAMTVAGGAILGAFGLMVKAHATFDKSMTQSLAIMGDISPSIRKEMEKTTKDMSTKTTFAAHKLADAYFFLASAGMNAEQSIKALPVVAKFAQAGAFDLAMATDLLTDAQTALGLSSKDAAENQKNLIRVSDVLVGANTLANASVLQFSESLTNKAAAALVNVNKEVEEGVAVLAAYADKGVKGRLAGQRLTMMLNGLFDATRRNKKAWDEAGISLFKADGSMRDIADIIQDLEGYLGAMTVQQREAALAMLGFNLKTKDSILTLMGSSEKIRKWTEDLKGMGGKTKEVSDKQLKTFNNQLILLKNTVIKAAISIGQRLTPMIGKLVASVKDVAARITAWIDEHPRLTEQIGKLALGVGALMTVLGPLAMMLPGLVTGFGLLKVAVIALASPAGLAALAIAGIALSLKDMIDTLKEAKKEMRDFADEAAVFADAAKNFELLWIAVRQEGGETLEQFNELAKRFGGNWESIMKTIVRDPKFATLKALLLDIASGVKTIDLEGGKLSITLPEGFLKTKKAVKETREEVQRFLPPWVRLGEGVAEFSRTVAAKLMTLKGIASKALDLGPAFKLPDFTLGEKKFGTFGEFLKKWFEATLEDMKAEAEKFWDALFSGAQNAVNAMDAVFGQLHENQTIRLDNQEKQRTDAIESWFEQERAKIEATIANEEEKIAALEALDEEKARRENKLQHDIDKERRKLARAEAKSEKTSGLFSAGINMAEAITKAFTAGPFIGQVMAGIVATLCAIQIAAIADAPLPALAAGGRIGREGGIVGERGPELFVPDRPGEIIPLHRESGGIQVGGAKVDFNFYAPIIQTTGLSNRDLDGAAEYFFRKMEDEARRRGYSLNGP